MRVLLCSHRFHPSVGGIETVGKILAEEFTGVGHDVRVLTSSASEAPDSSAYTVLRQTSLRCLLRQTRWADLCLHNNISLRTAWPLPWIRKPWVVIHHTWIQRPDGSRAWRDRLKLRLLRLASSVSISEAVAQSLPGESTLIPDPYDDHVFGEQHAVKRERDIIMVGRLVSDKGADLLLEALSLLKARGLSPNLTIVGAGPERPRLEAQRRELRLSAQVRFAGEQSGLALARLLNQHRILAVPSRWQEPFGLVALEGIACGCVVVGSSGGGLTEAIGPCGLTFPNNQVAPLAEMLSQLLGSPAKLDHFRAPARRHLERHSRRAVATRYLNLMERLLPASVPHPPRACAASA